MARPLFLQQYGKNNVPSVDNMEHLMAVETLLPKGAILGMRDVSQNYFAADKGKNLTC